MHALSPREGPVESFLNLFKVAWVSCVVLVSLLVNRGEW